MTLFKFNESCDTFVLPIELDNLNESIQDIQERIVGTDIDILLSKPSGLVSEMQMYELYQNEIIENVENTINEQCDIFYTSLLETVERKEYGLPSQQKFPMRNEKELKNSLTMFRYSNLKDRKELSVNLITECLLQQVELEENNIIFKFSDVTYDKYLQEKEMLFKNINYTEKDKEKITNECLQEGVNIDSEGNMILKLREKTDFMSKYNTSHKLMKIYMATGNTTGVKTELCKLWYMYTIIEYYYSGRNNINPIQQRLLNPYRDEALKAKGFIMNDFTNGLKWLLHKEPNFNFSEYFAKTDYYKDIVKIDTKGLSKLIKNVMETLSLNI